MTQTNRCWTVMVYMAGDNGKVFEQLQGQKTLWGNSFLEPEGYANIQQMEAVGSTEQVAILVQFDTLSDNKSTYLIDIGAQGEKPCIENIPSQNTGDPKSLTNFIVWGIDKYPAQYYSVIIWGHGNGWKEDDIYTQARNSGIEVKASNDEVRSFTTNSRFNKALFVSSIVEVLSLDDEASRGIAFDDSSLDFLDNANLQQAFLDAEKITGQKVNLIGMDACLMSMVEVAYQLRANADYMVGSQEIQPTSGWPYQPILQKLTTNPEMTPEGLAKLIVQEYGSAYESYYNETRGNMPRLVTQSATNLKLVGQLAEAIGKLAKLLCETAEEDFDLERALGTAKRKATYFNPQQRHKDSVDLYDFLRIVDEQYTGDNDKLIALLKKVMQLLSQDAESKVVSEHIALGVKNSYVKGLAIYLPKTSYSPFYGNVDFAKYGWGEFLQVLNKLIK